MKLADGKLEVEGQKERAKPCAWFSPLTTRGGHGRTKSTATVPSTLEIPCNAYFPVTIIQQETCSKYVSSGLKSSISGSLLPATHLPSSCWGPPLPLPLPHPQGFGLRDSRTVGPQSCSRTPFLLASRLGCHHPHGSHRRRPVSTEERAPSDGDRGLSPSGMRTQGEASGGQRPGMPALGIFSFSES